MNKKPTIAELEDFMGDGKDVRITPSGQVIINNNPVVHVLEDVLRIAELEKALQAVKSLALEDMEYMEAIGGGVEDTTAPKIVSIVNGVMQSPDVQPVKGKDNV
jgi:benzoyl-CoA reductase/2-hydroxyglutaryl-CoA dehydratase subunit BcrC/BadD/HgdB